MRIAKAVITAAAPSQRNLPLQTFVDRDGQPKTALRIIVEEAFSAGVEEACVVVAPGDGPAFDAALASLDKRIQFVEQAQPRGYGHAVLCARDFAAGQPVLHLVGDHMYVRSGSETCAQQLVEAARAENCAVSAVQPTREALLPYFGVVGGRPLPAARGQRQAHKLYEVERAIEKPTPTQAEQNLMVAGLRAGHYLCFFGMHVLTPTVFELLAEDLAAADGNVALTPALDRLAARERYLALEVDGRRHDIGARYGALSAQLALALSGQDRDEVLAQLLEHLVADSAAAHRNSPVN